MLMYRRLKSRRRSGLTLLELIVVLMILVATAGILIPMFPSMLTRAHVSTHTTNTVELAKAMAAFQSLNNAFPDQYDSLTDGTVMVNYLAGGALDPLPPPAAGQAGGEITASAPTAAELTALNAAGIFKVHVLVGTPAGTTFNGNAFDPTFNNYSAASTAPTTITATTKLAFFDPAANANALARLQSDYPGWSPTARYVVLGVGPRCTLIGRGGLTSPVHFGDTPAVGPEAGYGRFCAIFKVSDPNAPGGINMAQLVGIAPLHDTGMNGLDAEFQNWYQINNGGS